MKRFSLIAVAALATVMIGSEAFAQRHAQSRSVTHSPSIHRGNHGQSAIHVGPQRSTVYPGTKIHVNNRTNYRPGHHQGYGNRYGHNNRYAKRHHRHIHGPVCVFTAAHYDTQHRQIWVPGHYEKQYVPPRYEFRYRHGHATKVLVANGYYTDVYIEGCYVSQPYQVWRPATWSCGFYY